MFASDYPHWDFDNPDLVFPTKIADDARRKIMGDNARGVYRLG